MSLDPFTSGFDLIKTGLDKIFPDADTELKGKLEQAAKAIDAELQITLAQIAVNQEQAKAPNVFVSGARPAMIWVGVASICYQMLFMPIANGILKILGSQEAFTGIDVSQLKPMISALLGV